MPDYVTHVPFPKGVDAWLETIQETAAVARLSSLGAEVLIEARDEYVLAEKVFELREKLTADHEIDGEIERPTLYTGGKQ